MARQIADTARMNVFLSKDQKKNLIAEAATQGFNTTSEFIQAIADGRLKYINADAKLLLDHIRANANS